MNCADIVGASARETSVNVWTISATVSSPYEMGWDQYADAFQVRSSEKVLGTRILAHPHVNEQPFTRSLSGISIPSNISSVDIFGRDLLNGYCGESFELQIREDQGEASSPTSPPTATPNVSELSPSLGPNLTETQDTPSFQTNESGSATSRALNPLQGPFIWLLVTLVSVGVSYWR